MTAQPNEFSSESAITIVEAFGMPGVGKSHAVHVLLSMCAERGVRINGAGFGVSRRARLARVPVKIAHLLVAIPQLLRHPRQAWTVARRFGLWRALRAQLNWLHLIGLVRSRQSGAGAIVLHQGFMQAFWSLCIRARDPIGAVAHLSTWWSLTMEMAGRPRISILWVEAGEETVLRRRSLRPEGLSLLDRSPEDHGKATSLLDALGAELTRMKAEEMMIVHLDNSAEDPHGLQLRESLRSLKPIDAVLRG